MRDKIKKEMANKLKYTEKMNPVPRLKVVEEQPIVEELSKRDKKEILREVEVDF